MKIVIVKKKKSYYLNIYDKSYIKVITNIFSYVYRFVKKIVKVKIFKKILYNYCIFNMFNFLFFLSTILNILIVKTLFLT